MSTTTEVVSEGFGSWVDPGRALPLAGDESGSIAALATVGRGMVVLVADTAPLQNRLLDRADNAAFALGLAGPVDRPVVFVESVHGYGLSSGLAALPPRWKASGLLLALATLTLMAAHVRRLGHPEAAGRDLVPARRAYLDSLAGTLARTRQPGAAGRRIQDEGLRLLSARTGVPTDAPHEEVMAAAEGVGLSRAEAVVLTGAIRDDRDLLLAGRALSRLGGRAREDGRR